MEDKPRNTPHSDQNHLPLVGYPTENPRSEFGRRRHALHRMLKKEYNDSVIALLMDLSYIGYTQARKAIFWMENYRGYELAQEQAQQSGATAYICGENNRPQLPRSIEYDETFERLLYEIEWFREEFTHQQMIGERWRRIDEKRRVINRLKRSDSPILKEYTQGLQKEIDRLLGQIDEILE
jgi:hypothetical protein